MGRQPGQTESWRVQAARRVQRRERAAAARFWLLGLAFFVASVVHCAAGR